MINSELASLIYRTSLSDIDKLKGELPAKSQLSRPTSINLKVLGHKNLSDVMALFENLKVRGKHLGLEVKLKSFKGGEAEALCFFQGEEKAFSDLLSQLKELKSSYNYRLESGGSGSDHFIKLLPE